MHFQGGSDTNSPAVVNVQTEGRLKKVSSIELIVLFRFRTQSYINSVYLSCGIVGIWKDLSRINFLP